MSGFCFVLFVLSLVGERVSGTMVGGHVHVTNKKIYDKDFTRMTRGVDEVTDNILAEIGSLEEDEEEGGIRRGDMPGRLSRKMSAFGGSQRQIPDGPFDEFEINFLRSIADSNAKGRLDVHGLKGHRFTDSGFEFAITYSTGIVGEAVKWYKQDWVFVSENIIARPI